MTEARRTYLESQRRELLDVLSRPWLVSTDANRFSLLWADLHRIEQELEIG